MYEGYYQANARDEFAVGVITVDGLPRYVVVHGGFAVFPVGRPVAHTHPKGTTVLPSRNDTQRMSIGEHRYIYSLGEEGAERLTTYTKLNDENTLLIRVAIFKNGQQTEHRYIMTDPTVEMHLIPLE